MIESSVSCISVFTSLTASHAAIGIILYRDIYTEPGLTILLECSSRVNKYVGSTQVVLFLKCLGMHVNNVLTLRNACGHVVNKQLNGT